jgi:hypothetical protein
MYDLATAEEDTHTNNITLAQELSHAIHLGLEVMLTNLDGEFHFLQPRTMLGFSLALLLLIVIFAVIYNFADDRLRERCHFHEIQTFSLGNRNGFIALQYTEVLARIVNDSDFTFANPFIDSQFSFVDPNLLASGTRFYRFPLSVIFMFFNILCNLSRNPIAD